MGIRMISSRKKRRFAVIRWLVFSVIIWFAFIFMTTGSFIKPNILIPIALCISMDEDALVSAIIGFVCGFLSDLAMGDLIGSGAIILIFGCVCTSLLFTRLLRQLLLNFSVIMILYSAIHFSFKYFFSYMIWGYDSETESNVVWVYVSYLRKKLAAIGSDVKIKASRNAGYSLVTEDK